MIKWAAAGFTILSERMCTIVPVFCELVVQLCSLSKWGVGKAWAAVPAKL